MTAKGEDGMNYRKKDCSRLVKREHNKTKEIYIEAYSYFWFRLYVILTELVKV